MLGCRLLSDLGLLNDLARGGSGIGFELCEVCHDHLLALDDVLAGTLGSPVAACGVAVEHRVGRQSNVDLHSLLAVAKWNVVCGSNVVKEIGTQSRRTRSALVVLEMAWKRSSLVGQGDHNLVAGDTVDLCPDKVVAVEPGNIVKPEARAIGDTVVVEKLVAVGLMPRFVEVRECGDFEDVGDTHEGRPRLVLG